MSVLIPISIVAMVFGLPIALAALARGNFKAAAAFAAPALLIFLYFVVVFS